MHVQLSLFPDAFGVHVAALTAMRDLEVPRSLELVRRARRLDPTLPNLDLLEEVLLWLGARLGEERSQPDGEQLATVLCGLAADRLAGNISSEGAAFGDEVIARYVGRRAMGQRWFLDDGERVHRGMLDLVMDRPGVARASLRECLDSGYVHRADLWGYLGDACFLLQRAGEASACYVRALLLSAADVDLARLRCPELAAIHGELVGASSPAVAREQLLAHACLDGVLDIPPGNDWLDGHLSRLRARAAEAPGAGAVDEQRHRRFALLLYLDRSAPRGEIDLALREEMAAIDAGLFARYMAECRRREERSERAGGRTA